MKNAIKKNRKNPLITGDTEEKRIKFDHKKTKIERFKKKTI